MDVANVRSRRQQERAMWRRGLVVSLLLHLAVLLIAGGPPIPPSPFAAAGPKAGDNRAAAGGMQSVNVVVPPPRPIRPPEIPLPVEIEMDVVDLEPEPVIEIASLLGERPGPPGPPGLETGDGAGDGGTAEEGLRRVMPPTPRGMIIPPANRSLRGTTVDVWVFVDEIGQVVPDSTRLDPATRDRGFNRQLIREAAEWIFRPGTQNGEPVAAWFRYTISM